MLEDITLNSKRLFTRNLENRDIETLFRIYSDKESMKFRGSKPLLNLDDAQEMVEQQYTDTGDNIKVRKAIIKKETDKIIGTLLLEWNKAFENRCEIGFSIDKKEWKNGYATETLDALLDILKNYNHIDEVMAWCVKRNTASVKLLERTGFIKLEQQDYPESFLFIKKLDKTTQQQL